MLLKVDIDSQTMNKIKQLIDGGRYDDVYQFVSIAIKNQIQEELAESDSTFLVLKGQELQTQKSNVFSEISPFKSAPDWLNLLKKLSAQESEVEPNYEQYDDLIWSFYNRFLPVKIIIRELAIMVVSRENWIELADLESNSYQHALEISQRLREYEEQHDLSRNQRLSTGLPTPISELNSVRGVRERRKIQSKIESSRKRFMEQFVGKKIRINEQDHFKGSCFDMGLMAVKFSGNTTLVNLTRTGKEFALLCNPILDEQKKDMSLSTEESDFILKRIIPKFKLENIIVNRILRELVKNKLSSEEINEIFKEEKMMFLKEKGESTAKIEEKTEEKTITQERVATMGRLSELGLVTWDIGRNKGPSTYTIKKP